MPSEDKARPLLPQEIKDPREDAFAEAGCRGYLPHLEKAGCSYFVTFCLADVTIARRKARERLDGPADPEEIAASFEPQRLAGDCLLRIPEIADVVERALLYFQGERYALSAWCVMPNHVHAVVTPYAGHHLGRVLHSWKSYTAHRVNRMQQRSGPLWQEESFDHLIRSAEAFEKFVTYTELNPVTAGLVLRPEQWLFSSARFRGRC